MAGDTTAALARRPSDSVTRDGVGRGMWSVRDGRAGVLILLVLTAAGLMAPLIAPYAPDTIDPGALLHGLTWRHPLGSDDFGRDVLSRLLYAYRASLLVAAASTGLALPLGGIIGVLSGYFGGAVDTVLMRSVEMLLAFPALLLGLALISVLGPGTGVTILAIAISYVPVLARTARSSTLVVRGRLYVAAARVRGGSHRHILYRHVLPNAIGPCLTQASVLAGIAIQIEAALSYLGLGVRPPTPSLGSMLAEGQGFLAQAPWICVVPGVALALTTLGFNLLGNALRHSLDPDGGQ
ncbi:MAG: ABC transporter permease [Actinoallomurus sp.]